MNKKALVTGSSRGIGFCIAKVLSDIGYDVVIAGRNEEKLKETAKNINAYKYIVADLTNDSDLTHLVKEAGNIDVLINNAGDYVYSCIENTKETDIHRLIKLNTEVPYILIKNFVSHMKEQKWGRIINIGSISGVVGEANASLYSMTKSSFTGLTKALGLELAEYGITVNTINPGWVKTELAENAVENSDFSYQEEIDMIPQKRFIHPDEIAELVKYLVSNEAMGVTAQTISICAGLSAG